MVFKFGSMRHLCEVSPLPLCLLISNTKGSPGFIEPSCYSRNIEVFNFMIFEPATLVAHLVAIIMTAIMIYHVRSKYMAVGRKEVVMFFYMYLATIIVEALVYTVIIPMSSPIYRYFVFLDISLIAMTLWCFFVNGFTGFQIIEDGTPLSLWSIRISSLLVFGITYGLTYLNFSESSPLRSNNPTIPYYVIAILGGPLVLLYALMQIGMILTKFGDKWPLGDIILGLGVFTLGILSMFMFSDNICYYTGHYIDGIFVGTVCNLLSVMMVYKYWDSITKEDLEFSVGSRANVWELKDPLISSKTFTGGPAF